MFLSITVLHQKDKGTDETSSDKFQSTHKMAAAFFSFCLMLLFVKPFLHL